MSDRERLASALASGQLLPAVGSAPSTVDLTRALARLAGLSLGEPGPHEAALAAAIGPADHLVLVLADGLALDLVAGRPEASPLRAGLRGEVRAVFPASTAVALTTIATGEWPARHGILGWWLHLPELGDTATVLPFVRRRDQRPLADLGVAVEAVLPLESLAPRLGRDFLSLLPHEYVDTVYSRWASGGTRRQGFATLAEAVELVLARVERAAGPTYTYLYWPAIDGRSHAHGSRAPQVLDAVAELEGEWRRLVAGLAGRGRAVLSADHGHLDVPARGWDTLLPGDPLCADLLVPPAGDSRVLFFHVARGRERAFADRFRARFGARWLLLDLAEVEELRLLGPGPLAAVTRRRAGSHMALSLGADTMVYVDGEEARRVAARLRSAHSGLTPAEMRVPLVVG